MKSKIWGTLFFYIALALMLTLYFTPNYSRDLTTGYDRAWATYNDPIEVKQSFPQRIVGNPTVAHLKNGGFVVVWEGYEEGKGVKWTDIYVQRYYQNGTNQGAEFRLDMEGTMNPGSS